MEQYRLSSAWLENSSAEKDLEALVDDKLNIRQKRALAIEAYQILGCVSRSVVSPLTEIILPLYSVFVTPHVEYCV